MYLSFSSNGIATIPALPPEPPAPAPPAPFAQSQWSNPVRRTPTRIQPQFNKSIALIPRSGNLIDSDDFETGSFASGPWGSSPNCDVTSTNPKDGIYSAEFVYEGSGTGGDAWSELRFDLGAQYDELMVKYDLYIPDNYEHRDESPDNNKYFRFWPIDFGDDEKIGASMKTTDGITSSIGSDYRFSAGGGMHTSVSRKEGFIVEADRGLWIPMAIYAKAPTATTNCVWRIYKNNLLFHSDDFDNDFIGGTNGYRYGYLLGWANSGFDNETIFYMDNVEFWDADVLE
jgi:hypothetical protein